MLTADYGSDTYRKKSVHNTSSSAQALSIAFPEGALLAHLKQCCNAFEKKHTVSKSTSPFCKIPPATIIPSTFPSLCPKIPMTGTQENSLCPCQGTTCAAFPSSRVLILCGYWNEEKNQCRGDIYLELFLQFCVSHHFFLV